MTATLRSEEVKTDENGISTALWKADTNYYQCSVILRTNEYNTALEKERALKNVINPTAKKRGKAQDILADDYIKTTKKAKEQSVNKKKEDNKDAKLKNIAGDCEEDDALLKKIKEALEKPAETVVLEETEPPEEHTPDQFTTDIVKDAVGIMTNMKVSTTAASEDQEHRNKKGHTSLAKKCPRNYSTCHSCVVFQKKIKELEKEIERLKSSKQAVKVEQTSELRPRPGKVTSEMAKEHKMVELLQGTGVYLYYQQLAAVQSSKTPTAAALYLMTVFWSRDERRNCNLTGANNKQSLDQDIIQAVVGFCLTMAKKMGVPVKESDLRRAMRNKLTSQDSKEKQVIKIELS